MKTDTRLEALPDNGLGELADERETVLGDDAPKGTGRQRRQCPLERPAVRDRRHGTDVAGDEAEEDSGDAQLDGDDPAHPVEKVFHRGNRGQQAVDGGANGRGIETPALERGT